jgi:hypothetical protein
VSVSQPVDSSILHEIVRVIESRRKVPEKVVVKSREYQLTYLEDHQRRMEEALMRYDADRLNMLYGQLASKIKYQLLRRLPARAAEAVTLGAAPAKRTAGAKKPAGARKAAPAKKVAAAKKSPAKAAARARPARKAAAAKAKKAAGATRAAAKRRPAKRSAKAAKRHK